MPTQALALVLGILDLILLPLKTYSKGDVIIPLNDNGESYSNSNEFTISEQPSEVIIDLEYVKNLAEKVHNNSQENQESSAVDKKQDSKNPTGGGEYYTLNFNLLVCEYIKKPLA